MTVIRSAREKDVKQLAQEGAETAMYACPDNLTTAGDQGKPCPEETEDLVREARMDCLCHLGRGGSASSSRSWGSDLKTMSLCSRARRQPAVGRESETHPAFGKCDELIFAAQYIRAFVPGGTFFFTVTLLERRREMK